MCVDGPIYTITLLLLREFYFFVLLIQMSLSHHSKTTVNVYITYEAATKEP
jgi:hypothetical protein